MRLGLLLIAVMALLAQDKPSGITPELRAKFWRAKAEFTEAQAIEMKAKAALDQVIQEMQKTCADQQLVSGQDGEPQCQPKPDKPTEKK